MPSPKQRNTTITQTLTNKNPHKQQQQIHKLKQTKKLNLGKN